MKVYIKDLCIVLYMYYNSTMENTCLNHGQIVQFPLYPGVT
jgi:hypothetical protein